MKRNLSSQAIKAMAIGMAITMGSSSIAYADQPITLPTEDMASIPTLLPEVDLSDVPTTLPNDDYIYPETSVSNSGVGISLQAQATNPGQAPIANDTIAVTIDSNTYNFKVTNADSTGDNEATDNGAVTLVSISDSTTTQLQGTNFTGEIVDTVESTNTVKVTTGANDNKKYYFKITKIGSADVTADGTDGSIGKGKTISATEFTKVFTKDVIELGNNALNGLTITGDVVLSTNEAGVKLGKNTFKNLKVDGNFDLSTSKFLNRNSSSEITELSDLGLGALDSEIVSESNGIPLENANYGVKVTGELKLPTSIIIDNASLKNTEIGKIDLTPYEFKNGNAENNGNGKIILPKGLFGNAVVNELILDPTTTTINPNTFAGATLTKFDFSKITQVNWGGFKGATINGDLDLSNANIAKQTFGKLKADEITTILKDKDTTINGSLTLKDVKYEKSNLGFLTDATITGNLILDNTNEIPATTDINGAFGGVNVGGTISLTGVNTIPDNAFKGATLPNNITLDATTIGANAFELANQDVINITLTKPVETATNINVNAFGSNTKVNLNVPFGSDVENLKNQFKDNTNIKINSSAVVENENGTYIFEEIKTETDAKEVALVGFNKKYTKAKTISNSFANGILNYNGTPYNLTKIGNGSALTEITNEALNGNTKFVKEISANAFADNKNITSASFPVVEKVGSKAFANTNITSISLGTETKTPIDIPNDAFNGVSTLKDVETNKESKDTVKSAIEGSSSSNISLDAGGNKETVKPDDKGNSGSGSGSGSSSGGGSSSGSGANIGTNNDKTTESTTTENNSNNTTPIVENKTLTLDVISLPSVTGEPKVFGDVSSNHWAKAHIDKLSTAGIINGSNGNFNPNGQTKRADVTIMLVNLLGLTPENNNKFTDVNPNAYYAPYVGTASSYGIINGSNGMFNPEGIISRQDTMVMIAQILKSLNLNVNTDTTTLSQFSDANSISPYANESVAILVNSGIISGNNGKLNPKSPVTRAEMATIMSKLYDVLNNTK